MSTLGGHQFQKAVHGDLFLIYPTVLLSVVTMSIAALKVITYEPVLDFINDNIKGLSFPHSSAHSTS